MPNEIHLTPEERAYDLRGDLEELRQRDGREYDLWVRDNADESWPIAIKRALVAETLLRHFTYDRQGECICCGRTLVDVHTHDCRLAEVLGQERQVVK